MNDEHKRLLFNFFFLNTHRHCFNAWEVLHLTYTSQKSEKNIENKLVDKQTLELDASRNMPL